MSIVLNTDRFELRELGVDDVSQRYVDWLNDPQVNRFLEVRHQTNSLESLKTFIGDIVKSADDFMFGIFTRDTHRHIGNIRLGPINRQYRRAVTGLLIGELDWWGKGVALEVIQVVSDWGFAAQNLHKIEAGCYSTNMASVTAFTRAGYREQGRLKEHFIDQGNWVDFIYLYRLEPSSP